ncbi:MULTISPECIES: glycoside hydrolase family 3 protein [Brevibacillus]|jgi:beta-N-acetylhexosaminidase|uniref:glycoside hydrolase family 3 protein n=1 Tax=Brevibacillus TaxID=55080 RepID=UPI0004F3A0A5|nr:glycoside hydrolase family 3 protein [Brevibacillus borstelensis]KKX56460.1 glycoside hydrolase [Brevibacillus borstelensis cifa_chp40]MBE5398257.1 glycoside hydrolase [Brevibacillus borstelensis]MCC0564741.1 glycoside hydrolase family 3 protein [Brevibacillus borstelensis]MCM3468823.1 glycoside hydrolase family 3 protein [Brevibacillus borstelensis]MCM3556980.1 glycoside hydrolase family 3 protein [Brevibacillus borstelensis]
MRTIGDLSLREKIGQMLVCGFDGHQPTDGIRDLIRQYGLGNIIYFSRNAGSVEQVHRLSSELKQWAAEHSDIPLGIAIDQEGGMVTRVTNGVTPLPGNMAIGATRDESAAFELARISGSELRLLGININFAPAVDINNNPLNPVIGVRSYGETPELVSRMGVAAVRGFQSAGIAATVKHFPGHGDTSVDSHFDIPVLPLDRKRLEQLELVPFKKAVEAGVDMVMTAHIVLPEIEPKKLPSTLSPAVITGILREEWGYDGIVITDCLEMDAIAAHYGVGPAAVMAVEAGVDLIMVSHRYDRQREAFEALLQAVIDGRISEERIDRSVTRILRLKQQRKMEEAMLPWEAVEPRLEAAEERRTAERISEQSITVVKDEGKNLPLRRGADTCVIWPVVRAANDADERYADKETLASYLSSMGMQIVENVVATNPTPEEIAQAVASSKGFGQVIVATYNAAFFPGQSKLVDELLAVHGKRLIVAAIRNPFDYSLFPEAGTYVCSYESRPLAMQSLARVLTGRVSPTGKLPVTLSTNFAFGWRG